MSIYSNELNSPPKSKSSIPLIAVGVIVVLFAAGLYSKQKAAQQAAALAQANLTKPLIQDVFVAPVTTATIREHIDITGSLVANQDVILNPKITGHVAAVLVGEGQPVTAGQLVVKLDDTDLRQQELTAEANFQSAQVKLDQAKAGLPAQIAEINNAVVQAQANLASARAKYQEALLDEPTKITTAQSQVQTAEAGLDAAKSRLKQARDTATLTQEQTDANIANAKAALSQSQSALQAVVEGNRVQQVNAAQAQVNLYQAQLDNSKTSLTREQQLYAGGATSKANVDAAQTNYNMAEAEFENAQQNFSLVKEGSRSEDVQQAEQTVAQRQANLLTAQAATNQVLVAQSDVTNALAALAQAEETLRQAESNLSQIPITREATTDALSTVNNAEAALEQAIANKANIPVQEENVPAAQAAVDSAQAALDQAKLNVGYCSITSPIDGVVNAKSVDVGQTVATATQLLEIVSLNGVYFEAQIPSTQLGVIHAGQTATVLIPSVSDAPVTGQVTAVIPVADVHLRQFRVRIGFPGMDGKLTPGAFAHGSLQTRVVDNAVTVSDDYLRNESGQTYLLVVDRDGDDGIVHRRNVQTGIDSDGVSEILSGVKSGELIVTSNETLEDGAKVHIVAKQ